MKRIQRIIAGILCAALIVMSVPASIFAQEDMEGAEQTEGTGENQAEKSLEIKKADARIEVVFGDEDNKEGIRPAAGADFLRVNADGVRMEEQPEIMYADAESYEKCGAWVQVYLIKNLPVTQEDGSTQITYTVSEEMSQEYEAFDASGLSGDEGEVNAFLELLAAPSQQITLTYTGAEYTADKKFGNYLQPIKNDMEEENLESENKEQDVDAVLKENKPEEKESEGLKSLKASGQYDNYSAETIKKEWINSHPVTRPNLVSQELLKVEYKIGEGTWTAWKAGGLGISLPMSEWMSGAGGTPIASVADNGIGYETYKITLPHTYKEGETEKTIQYRFSENIEKVKEIGYLPFVKKDDKENELHNIISEPVTFKVRLNTGAVGKVTNDFAKYITVKGKDAEGKEYSKTLEELGEDAVYNEDGTVTVQNLPRFTYGQEEISYTITMESQSAKEDTKDTNDKYVVTYDNAASPNYGTVTDACHEGGTLMITLTGSQQYEATKVWLDDKKEAAKKERPDADFYLWRYIQREGSDYTKAAMVKNPDGTKNISWSLKGDDKLEDEKTITTADIVPDGLPKYDPEGYLYIYFTREDLSGSTYTQRFGAYDEESGKIVETKEMLPDGMEKREPRDTSVYNGGVLSNLRTGQIDITLTKMWEAASFQSQLKNVAVEFTLFSREKDDNTEGKWENTKIVQMMDGFFAEQLTQTITRQVSKYDERGIELEYRWRETNVVQAGENGEPYDTKFDSADNTFTLKQKDASGELQDVVYRSEEKNGVITNRIADKTDYTVQKIWRDSDGNDVTENTTDKEITVVLYRDNVRYAKYTMDSGTKKAEILSETDEAKKEEVTGEEKGWTMKFDNLPKYDATGHKYAYYAEEEEVSGYYAAYEYDVENRKAVITNIPGEKGQIIRVRKEWIDDGDDTHRTPVKVQIYNKNDPDEVYGECTLTERHYWWDEIGIDAGKYGEIDLSNCGVRELSTCSPDITNPQDIKEGQMRVYEENGTTFADTKDHKYQVTYDYDQEREMFVVTNRRIGLINLTVRKYWTDHNNEKENRPEGAKLTLGCIEYPTAVTEKEAEGTVTIGQAVDWPVLDNEGNPAGSIQTVRTDDDKEGEVYKEDDDGRKYSEYYFFHLPKYDDTGKVVHYQVTEQLPKDSENEYVIKTTGEGYEVGVQHSDDTQKIEITNQKNAVKDVKFYKLWRDYYNYESTPSLRPDIYLTLYKKDSVNAEPVKVEEYIDRKWTRHADDGDYFWTCDFGKLPKYDDNGAEIIYYAKESSMVDAASFDYLTDDDAVYDTAGTYKAFYGNKDDTGQPQANETAEAEGGGMVLKEGGTFVNRIASSVTIKGKKIWKNIPSGMPEADFPKLIIHVDREADGENKEEDVAFTEDLHRIGASSNFEFTISQTGDNTRIEDSDVALGTPLPKYTEAGALYKYSVKEEVDDKGQLEGVTYESLPGEVNNFIITNIYNLQDKNAGHLKAVKTWGGITDTSKYQYPAVEFKLYRQYVSNDPTMNTSDGKTKPEQVDTKILLSSKKNGGEVVFDSSKLRIYAPNGTLYYYYVEETLLHGYSYNGQGKEEVKKSTPQTLEQSGSASPATVAFTNTYEPDKEKISVTGSKEWEDYENTFNTRPDWGVFVKTLTFERYASAQNIAGGAPAIKAENITIQIQSDKPNDPYFMEWTQNDEKNDWEYSIKNLERYAPNSMPWQYRVKEPAWEGYQASPENETKTGAVADSAKGETDATGGITMPALKNSFYKKAAVTKTWTGENAYNLRPSKITLKLQFKKGTEAWKDASLVNLNMAGFTGSEIPFKTELTMTAPEGNPDQWGTAEITKLPSMMEGENVSYRLVETQIGAGSPNDPAIPVIVKEQTSSEDTLEYEKAGIYQPSQNTTTGAPGAGECDTTVLTNTMMSDKVTSLKVIKKWEDSDNEYGTRPESADGQKYEIKVKLQRAVQPAKEQENQNNLVWSDVKDISGAEVVRTITGDINSKEDKEAVFENLPLVSGTKKYFYRAAELTETDGYQVKYDYELNEDNEQDVTTITNALSPVSKLNIEKIWKDSEGKVNPALGAGKTVYFEIRKLIDENGAKKEVSFAAPKIVSITGGEDSESLKAAVDNLPTLTDTSYVVREVVKQSDGSYQYAAPSGFYKTEETNEQPEKTSDGGSLYAATVTNIQTKFSVVKADNETGKPLESAVLAIYAAEDFDLDSGKPKSGAQPKDSFTTTITPHSVVGLDAGTEGVLYVLYEEKAPTGYDSIKPVTFKLHTDNRIEIMDSDRIGEDIAISSSEETKEMTITAKDTRIRGHVSLKKTIKDGKPGTIEGTEFALYKQAGTSPDISKDTKIAEGIAVDSTGVWNSNNSETKFIEGEDKGDEVKKGFVTGTYYFLETKATADTELNSETYDFTIGDSETKAHGETVSVYAENKAFLAAAALVKLDEKSGEEIDGATFSLSYVPEGKTEEETQVITSTTEKEGDNKGKITFTNLPKGSYTLEETKIDGYDIEKVHDQAHEPFKATFTITDEDNGQTIQMNKSYMDAHKGKINVINGNITKDGITNARLLGSVTLYKADGDDKAKALDGVEFKLMKKEKENFLDWMKGMLTGKEYQYTEQEIITGKELNTSGQLTIKDLDWGTYKLVEVKAKAGYSNADKAGEKALETIEFTIDRDSIKEVELNTDGNRFYNYQTLLEIRKKGVDGESGLSGAAFLLKGNTVSKEGETISEPLLLETNEEGKIILKGQLIGGEKYTLEENNAPAGYEKIQQILTFRMKENGEAEVISGQEESSSKPGYMLTDSGISGNVLTVQDEPIEVKIAKRDKIGENALKGAVFEVAPAKNSKFAAEVAGNKIVLNDANMETAMNKLLLAGNTYILTETKAPKGYAKAAPITFSVNEYGTVEIIEGQDFAKAKEDKDKPGIQVIEVTDKKITARFKKRLVKDLVEDGIPGAQFVITPEPGKQFADGSEKIEFTTTKEPYEVSGLFIAGDSYTIAETKAPEGAMGVTGENEEMFKKVFKADEYGNLKGQDGDLLFDEAADGIMITINSAQPEEITFWDMPTALRIMKKDKNPQSESEDSQIADCTFEVTGRFAPDRYGSDETKKSSRLFLDAAVETITVTTDGRDELDNKLKGRLIEGEAYTIKEIIPPGGYELGMSVTFTVNGTKTDDKGNLVLDIALEDTNQGYEIFIDEEGNPVIIQRDQPIELKIQKTDMSGKALAGAKFILTGIFAGDEEESERSFISDDKGYVDLSRMLNESSEVSGKEYIYKLEEEKAPDGYVRRTGYIYFKMESVQDQDGRRSQVTILYDGKTKEDWRSYLTLLTSEDNAEEEILKIANEEQKKAADIGAASVKGAKTGDLSHYGEYLLWTILSGAVLIFTIRRKRKS